MVKRRRGHRKDLGSLFAASIVIVAGAAVCSALFLVGDPDASPWLLAPIGAIVGMFLAVIIGVRIPRLSSGLGFWHAFFGTQTADRENFTYEPRRAGGGGHTGSANHRPITAQEAHEIHMLSTSTWIPSRTRNRRLSENDRQLS